MSVSKTSNELPLFELPVLPETESESEGGGSLIGTSMDNLDMQASQSSIDGTPGSFDFQNNDGVPMQFSGGPGINLEQNGLGTIPQSQPMHVPPVPPNMNFHPVNMANIAQSMHMLQQMQQMRPFPHPIVPPSLHLSEDDIARIASKIKELLGDEIKTLVKTQVEAAVAPLRDELNSTKSDLAKVHKELTIWDSIPDALVSGL